MFRRLSLNSQALAIIYLLTVGAITLQFDGMLPGIYAQQLPSQQGSTPKSTVDAPIVPERVRVPAKQEIQQFFNQRADLETAALLERMTLPLVATSASPMAPELAPLLKYQSMPVGEASEAFRRLDAKIQEQNQQLLDNGVQLRALILLREELTRTHWLEILFGKKFRSWRFAWICLFALLWISWWYVGRRQWRQKVLGHTNQLLQSRWLRGCGRMVALLAVVLVVSYSDLLPIPLPEKQAAGLVNELTPAQADLLTRSKRIFEDYAKKREEWKTSAKQAGRQTDAEIEFLDKMHERLPVLAGLTMAQTELVNKSRALLEEYNSSNSPGRNDQSLVYIFGAVLTATWLLLGSILLLRSRKELQIRTQTCPRCLSVGNLTVIGSGSGPNAVPHVECTYVPDEPDDPSAATGSKLPCQFRFPQTYSKFEKLYFPTLGIPQSGKTFWTAMTYDRLQKGNYSDDLSLKSVRSSESETVKRIVNEVLHEKETAATQTSRIPFPIIFNFEDRDSWGTSNVLVYVFDYSGEVVRTMNLEDPQRIRALTANGYLYFIDPLISADQQVQALADFREDAELIANQFGRRLDAPVAICIPKIDLFPNAPNGDCPEVRDFYDALMEIDPSGKEISLRAIEDRHREMAKLVTILWGDWNIEQSFREVFGERCRFFPLTPVGVEQIGEVNLENRDMIPRFIVEPIIWLLHMNGFPVFKR